ncbi:hypothetical protein KJ705_02770 [Patescibacteria group bacterium]|nr:hypothetical protein [Patescibacteria group bacterium]
MDMLKHVKRSSLSKVVGVFVSVCVVSLLVVPQSLLAADPTVSAPTLVWPVVGDSTIQELPVITGLTENNTKVEVFIDGQLNGMATVKEDEKGTASFAYVPFLPLEPGNHAVAVAAVDEDSNAVSLMSKEASFMVEEPYPAPTLFQPVVNSKTVSTKPFITGLAVNDSLVKVFVDGELNGQFQVEDHESGVASFAYQPFLDLDPATDHLVYVTAVSPQGKESVYSNVVGFFVKAPEVSTEEYTDPQVLGVNDTHVAVEDISNEAVNEEETTSNEESTIDENGEDEAMEDETNEDADENEDSDEDQSTLVWWVILAIIVIIIAVNLRGRGDKGDQGGLKGLEKLGGNDNKSSDDSGQQTLLNKEKSQNNEGGNNMPPSPPSK